MRVAMVTESFLPQINGVTVSVQRLSEQLLVRGHSVLIIAPEGGVAQWAGVPVVGVPSVPVPGYATHRVARPWPRLSAVLRAFAPDVIHLASPAVLGAQAAVTAERLGIGCLAVYQTDLAAYAGFYRAPAAAAAVWRWLRWVHAKAGTTLAPSTHAVAELRAHGIPRVRLWPRGVDLDRFQPRRRDPRLRRELLDGAELLVGYVGRLAPEKQVQLLSEIDAEPGVRLVIVGDGPYRAQLERALPHARFLGLQQGDRLAALYASLDVFVHTGPHETFCQAAQEALASGVPVVAPAAGGLLDLVVDGRNGWLYPAGSAAVMGQRVGELHADPARRAEMSTAARESVLGRDWAAVTDDYLLHAEALLTSTRPARTA